MFEATYILVWALVAIQGLVICFLVKNLAELRDQLQGNHPSGRQGLEIGSVAPTLAGTALRTGASVSTASFRGHPTTVLALAPDCSTCRSLARALPSVPAHLLKRLIVYCDGSPSRCTNLAKELVDIVTVLVGDGSDVAAFFRLRGLPALIDIDSDGKLTRYFYPYDGSDIERYLRENLVAQPGVLEPATVS